MILLSFCTFLALMTLVGISASRRNQRTSADYILAGRQIGPIATALSAVSTCHSGFMFIGMIGFTYVAGISAIWLIIAWLIGDFVAWRYIYPKLRQESAASESITIASFITHSFKSNTLRSVLSAIVLVFLSVYAAAQLTAGSKALWIMLEWPNTLSILVGAGIVIAYSFSGGIRASIWTDVVQSIIMFGSMIGLCTVALLKIGGLSSLWTTLTGIDPSLTSLIPPDLQFGFPLYLLAWIAFGIGVIGQPHIVSRPMAIESTDAMPKATAIYLTWYAVFSFGSILVGLSARVLLPELISGDSELALPLLANQLLPSLFVGGILAGIFSATISTADSQIIACSSTITQDLAPKFKDNYLAVKCFTLLIMSLAVIIALFGSQSVYQLVIVGWSVMAAVLGPLLLLKCFKKQFTEAQALWMVGSVMGLIILWQFGLGWSGSLNETLPGFLMAFGVYYLYKKRSSH